MPGTQRHGFLDGLDIVELHHLVDFDALIAEEAVQFAADEQILIEADEVLAVQIGGLQDRFGGQWMRGRHSHGHLLFAPGNHGQLALGDRIADQAQIRMVAQDGFIDFVGPQIIDMQLRLRMAPLKFLAQAGHLRQADGIDGSYPHSAFGLALEPFERHQELFLAAQDFTAEVGVKFACIGQRQGARAAVDQAQTETALQLLDVLGGGGLADPVVGAALLMLLVWAISLKSLASKRCKQSHCNISVAYSLVGQALCLRRAPSPPAGIRGDVARRPERPTPPSSPARLADRPAGGRPVLPTAWRQSVYSLA